MIDSAAPSASTTLSVADRTTAEQLGALARNWIRVPLPVAAICTVVAYIAWPYVGGWAIAWALVAAGAIVARAAMLKRLMARPAFSEAPNVWAERVAAIAFLNGLLAALPALAFMPHMPAEQRAILTMILGGWAAATVGSNGPYPRSYYWFAIGFFPIVAFAWAWIGGAVGYLTAALLAIFGAMMCVFARDHGERIKESIALRFQNEALIDTLRRLNQEAASAQHAAEEANRSKSRFLAAASHDLRQPLHALSLLTALANSLARDPDQREVATSIERSVHSLDRLFSGLLDLSRLDAGVIQPNWSVISAREVLAGLEAEYRSKATAKGLRFEILTVDDFIATDPMLLERIVRNFLENAIRYTERGVVRLAAEREGESVRVSVADTGIGIPEAEQTRIFDEFYQIGNPGRDRQKGLGLGLAIVQRLGRLLDHRVDLASQEGQGSRFSVLVPVGPVAANLSAASPIIAPEADFDVAGACVLVVDDEREVREVMSLVLKHWDCVPLVAANLDEARSRLAEASGKPDVMLVDYRLGDSASGIDVIEALRAEIGDVPAALITGDTSAELLAQFERAHLRVLHKPVKPQDLKDLIHRNYRLAA
jgi:two-component system, sensor histidine kinase